MPFSSRQTQLDKGLYNTNQHHCFEPHNKCGDSDKFCLPSSHQVFRKAGGRSPVLPATSEEKTCASELGQETLTRVRGGRLGRSRPSWPLSSFLECKLWASKAFSMVCGGKDGLAHVVDEDTGLPWASLVVQMVKNLPTMQETQVQSPGEGHGSPLQYCCLENSMERGAWWATVHGVTKSWTQSDKHSLA